MKNNLTLHTTEGLYFIPIVDILHLESSGSYTTVWTTKEERILVCHNLGYFEDIITDLETSSALNDVLFRIHQSHIVRISNVRQLLKLPDGDFAVLNNGVKIPVARRRRKAFLEAMSS
jgi:two-component system, LytTR family, response regulator